jgi:hypothetical protein
MIEISKSKISVPFDEPMWTRRNQFLRPKFNSFKEYLDWFHAGRKIQLDTTGVERAIHDERRK